MLSISFPVPSPSEEVLGKEKPGQLKRECGKEARIRTVGRLAVVGAFVAVPPPGTARRAAVVHLQTARATESGPGTAQGWSITPCSRPLSNSLSLSHESSGPGSGRVGE